MIKTLTLSLSCLVLGAGLAFAQIPQIQNQQPTAVLIDYSGFMQLSAEIEPYRQSRLVPLAEFARMAEDPDTIILDTRSKAAFDEGHIKGAVHLNFSDFTDEKLAKVVGDKDRRILIYCNNNFTDDVAPFLKKRIELALNVPTFINLYGYGYKNVYELADGISVNHPDIEIISSQN